MKMINTLWAIGIPLACLFFSIALGLRGFRLMLMIREYRSKREFYDNMPDEPQETDLEWYIRKVKEYQKTPTRTDSYVRLRSDYILNRKVYKGEDL